MTSTYFIYRDYAAVDPTDAFAAVPLAFFPDKDSDELHDALRIKYPHLRTHMERMRNATIDFLREESQDTPTSFSADTSPWQHTIQSMSASPVEDQSPAFDADMIRTASNDSVANLTPMTMVFSLTSAQPPKPRTRRKMTEAEKVEYRKRRQMKACDKCAKRKRKCTHNQDNELQVQKVTKSTTAVTTKVNQQSMVADQIWSSMIEGQDIDDFTLLLNQPLPDLDFSFEQGVDYDHFEQNFTIDPRQLQQSSSSSSSLTNSPSLGAFDEGQHEYSTNPGVLPRAQQNGPGDQRIHELHELGLEGLSGFSGLGRTIAELGRSVCWVDTDHNIAKLQEQLLGINANAEDSRVAMDHNVQGVLPDHNVQGLLPDHNVQGVVLPDHNVRRVLSDRTSKGLLPAHCESPSFGFSKNAPLSGAQSAQIHGNGVIDKLGKIVTTQSPVSALAAPQNSLSGLVMVETWSEPFQHVPQQAAYAQDDLENHISQPSKTSSDSSNDLASHIARGIKAIATTPGTKRHYSTVSTVSHRLSASASELFALRRRVSASKDALFRSISVNPVRMEIHAEAILEDCRSAGADEAADSKTVHPEDQANAGTLEMAIGACDAEKRDPSLAILRQTPEPQVSRLMDHFKRSHEDSTILSVERRAAAPADVELDLLDDEHYAPAVSQLVCRQRKIKCKWSSDGAEVCNNCEARGRPCVSQVYSSASTESIRLTSRERIGKLETIVHNIQASILRLESKLSLESIEESNISDAPGGLADDASDSENSESSPIRPSAHLQQLFDNSLLGTPRPDYVPSPPRRDSHSPTSHRVARKALQDLVPPKSDVAIMEPFVGFWIALISTVFPSISLFETGHDILGRYESMFADDVSPILLANYLCPLAICVLHIPAQMVDEQMTVVRDGLGFVRQVSDVIEQFVFNDDQLMCTLEGIDMGLMFLRLQMLRGRIRKVWVSLRRIVAMCEMIGLPKAATSPPTGGTFGSPEQRQAAIDLWDCIVSADRMAGLMWGLPIGTASHKMTAPTIMMKNGQVNLLNVFVRLSISAAHVVEIDEMIAAQRPLHEVSEKIMIADQEWRAMVDMTPPRWWHSSALSVDSLLLYWYQYVGVRIHIQLALRNDERNTFAYSHMRCLEACRNMAIRYPMVRGALPTELFVGRLLDIQALTPAIFLLHTHYRPGQLQQTGPESPATLVKGILKLTDAIGDKTGGVVAKQIGKAIRSVIEILEGSIRGEARMMVLHVPTLGRINVGARTQTGYTKQRAGSTASVCPVSGLPTSLYDSSLTASDFEFDNSLDWVMEISEDFAFVGNDEASGQDVLSFRNFDVSDG